MKLKLDENLGRVARGIFESAGHDTATVASENLCGSADRDLISRCLDEDRALVTLDLDFANPLGFRPSDYSGIAVLRVSAPLSASYLAELCRTLVEALSKEELQGQLWIVEVGRIRVFEGPEE